MTAPAAGATVDAGTAVSLQAQLSPELAAALSSGAAGCSFDLGDDAGTATAGRLDTGAGTCSATVTYDYGDVFTISAEATDANGQRYISGGTTITVTGPADPRCAGTTHSPSTCVYRWAEAYYTADSAAHRRVCSIDGGCEWQTAHTSWTQLPGEDYWTNGNRPLADGNTAEAVLCIGSSPEGWTAYAGDHDLSALLARPDTSAQPVPAGTCGS